jgi:hypothetical protein
MVSFEKFQIAPCGINCGTCRAYLRERNKCSGCLSASGEKVNNCARCKIKNCESLAQTESKFCYDCPKFPCLTLRKIDKRYRVRYQTSLIQNLNIIRKNGIEEYLKDENSRWTCRDCGSVLSVHLHNCLKCGKKYNDPLFGKN